MAASSFDRDGLLPTFQLTAEDFSSAFGEQLSPYVRERIDEYNFRYRNVGLAERDHYIRHVVDMLNRNDLVSAGESRLAQWESGWLQHVEKIKGDFSAESITPGYFGKYNVLRWKQSFIVPLDKHFEQRSLAIIQDWLFDKFARLADCIYEFGCGTGHNLLRVRNVNKGAELWGLDWTTASQKILERLAKAGVDNKLHGRRFDFFEPDTSFNLAPGSIIYTSAALEQVGDRFHSFVDYLLRNKPSICIHIEPIAEFLDDSNLLDYLSVAYFKKRSYLRGFYSYLKALERDGVLKIQMARRTYIGSLFIEGYSVVVWSPCGMRS
jgi:trans-aconitate methyltransferase